MHNMEVNGKLDNDLCEKFIQSLFSKKSIRPQYISSSEFDHESLAVAILLASGQYNNAYMLVRWIGDKLKSRVGDNCLYFSLSQAEKF